MQTDPRYLSGKASPNHAYEIDYGHNNPLGGLGTYSTPVAPPFCNPLSGRGHDFPSQINGFEFQPSEICPKNFIIFDQTDNKSRIMYHPTLAHKFGSPNFNTHATHAHDGHQSSDNYDDSQHNFSSSLKEDTEDIEALLSSGDEEEEDDNEEEDDVVSTGRTPGKWGRSSLGSSCSTVQFKSCKNSTQNSFSSTGSSSESKRAKMRKMVKTLRGIIPGGDQMDTPAILDEAVRYLKSLKVEVNKLGIEDLEG